MAKEKNNNQCSIPQNFFRSFINDKVVYRTCIYSFCAILIICTITIATVVQKYTPELIEGLIRYSQFKCDKNVK